MTRLVIDASVAMKWLPLFDSERLIDQARQILGRRLRGEIEMLVPDLFWCEVASVLCTAVRKGMCQGEEAGAALGVLQEQELTTFPSRPLVASALAIAVGHGRSIYDSLYAALAEHTNAELVTADEKLANALAGHLPVKWLGAIN